LTDKVPRQRAIKSSTSTADPNAPPMWLPQMMAGILGPFAMMQAGGVLGAHQQNMILQAPAPQAVPLVNINQADQVATSSKRQLSIEYPDIMPWLISLDADPFRGKKQLQFTQYGATLFENGIIDLSDVVSLTPEKLQELGGMNFGIANRLIRYVKEDNEELQGDAKRKCMD
jgi:hypothetical protein